MDKDGRVQAGDRTCAQPWHQGSSRDGFERLTARHKDDTFISVSGSWRNGVVGVTGVLPIDAPIVKRLSFRY